MSERVLPVLVTRDDRGEATLRAPKVGSWSQPPEPGALIEAGSRVGVLRQLSHRFVLVAPEGVSGRAVLNDASVHRVAVAYGDVLCRIQPVASLETPASAAGAAPSRAGGALQVCAPTDGVFYRGPATGAPAYVQAGDRVVLGQPVGLIEVMKTFNPIGYGGAGLPDEAEVVAVLAADGAEVRAGQPLVAVKRL